MLFNRYSDGEYISSGSLEVEANMWIFIQVIYREPLSGER